MLAIAELALADAALDMLLGAAVCVLGVAYAAMAETRPSARPSAEPARVHSVCIFRFMHALYSRDAVRQVERDLPRMQCTVNGARVASVREFREAVAAVNPTHVAPAMPFACQTAMAVPLELAHEIAPDRAVVVLDGRGPLTAAFDVRPERWTVHVSKRMRVRRREPDPDRDQDRDQDPDPDPDPDPDHEHELELGVVYDSAGAAVMVLCEDISK